MSKILNFNIGVLGHVDSGKTSLSKGLSTIASTAAFDKNPGIYLIFLFIMLVKLKDFFCRKSRYLTETA